MNRQTSQTLQTPHVLAIALLVGILALGFLAYSLLVPPSSLSAEPRDGTAEGQVSEGEVTVFDDTSPAVANLDTELLEALRAAARDAKEEGIVFYVNSGWRSPALQQRLLDEAVAEYGGEAEARRWVASPERSAHVSGDAVDIGLFDAAYWLRYSGDLYGICQIYENEPWHFELRPEAVDQGCPAMYRDPTEDPRMR